LSMKEGLGELWQWLVHRRSRPVTPLSYLDQLPSDHYHRLGQLDGALRLALSQYAGVEVNKLERDAAIASLPKDLAERVNTVTLALDRSRFAEETNGDQLEVIRGVLVDLAGLTPFDQREDADND
jgi:hypothetical protein